MIPGKGGARPRAIITNDAGEKAKSWAAVVSDAARAAAGDTPPLTGAVRVDLVFHLKRPQSHYRASGALKPGAPTHAATKPDGDKLTRCVWDALTGILFTDDARIVVWSGAKPYSDDGRTGCTITVEPV